MKKTKIICILSFVVCLLLGNVVFAVEPSETEETECLSEISVSKEAERAQNQFWNILIVLK